MRVRGGGAVVQMRTLGLTPVTEQPMISPWRRTPRYQEGPMRCSFTSVKPAAANHCRVEDNRPELQRAVPPRTQDSGAAYSCRCPLLTSRYSCSVGNSIHASAKKRETGCVGCTGPDSRGEPEGVQNQCFCCMLLGISHHSITAAQRGGISQLRHCRHGPGRQRAQASPASPIMQATPPGLITRYASQMPRCGSGQSAARQGAGETCQERNGGRLTVSPCPCAR